MLQNFQKRSNETQFSGSHDWRPYRQLVVTMCKPVKVTTLQMDEFNKLGSAAFGNCALASDTVLQHTWHPTLDAPHCQLCCLDISTILHSADILLGSHWTYRHTCTRAGSDVSPMAVRLPLWQISELILT